MEVHHNVTRPAFAEWVPFSTTVAPLSYAWQQDSRGILLAHIILMTISCLIILPAALILKSPVQKLCLWSLCCITITAASFFAVAHRAVTEDLYENALHRKFGFFIILAVYAQTLIAIRKYFASDPSTHSEGLPRFTQLSQEESHGTDVVMEHSGDVADFEDSARSSETLYRRSNSSIDPTSDRDDQDLHRKATRDHEHQMSTCLKVMKLFSSAGMMLAVYVQILAGIATYCDLFEGHEIFNGLAHWIKSSVFFIFGVWVFARYLGGHALVRQHREITRNVSAETVECALIFTYGVVDLFLERLGHSSDPISHTDIQHISIAAMFAFGGLVGLLLESPRIRRLGLAVSRGKRRGSENRPTHSMNVMPSIVVFFTGMLMSVHHQDTVFASKVHAIWGYYYCVASVLRVLTYIISYTTADQRSQRPPTEILVAFTLIAGSIAFMLSARDVVQALEYYGIGLMFVISLTVAGSLGVLIWVVYIMCLNGVASQQQH